jgi:hypothetical protein
MSKEDTQKQIGKKLEAEAHRDAIHIAVAPVIAGVRLHPGQPIGFEKDGRVGRAKKLVGIVDPYLTEPVYEDERFYMFLFPNTITGLRHEWSHPAFDGQPEAPKVISQTDHKQKSREWLDGHANSMGLTLEAMLDHAQDWIEHENHVVQHGSENWRDDFDRENFWHHYEIYMETSVPAEKKEYGFYCCSC